MRSLVLLAWLGLCGVAACSDDDAGVDSPDVGGSCRDNLDCSSDSYCEGGSDFPDGMCTRGCRILEDCPFGSVCTNKESGICMIECRADADCRGGYKCKDQELEDGGKALVCKK